MKPNLDIAWRKEIKPIYLQHVTRNIDLLKTNLHLRFTQITITAKVVE